MSTHVASPRLVSWAVNPSLTSIPTTPRLIVTAIYPIPQPLAATASGAGSRVRQTGGGLQSTTKSLKSTFSRKPEEEKPQCASLSHRALTRFTAPQSAHPCRVEKERSSSPVLCCSEKVVLRDSLGRKTYEKTWLSGEGAENARESMARPDPLCLCR